MTASHTESGVIQHTLYFICVCGGGHFKIAECGNSESREEALVFLPSSYQRQGNRVNSLRGEAAEGRPKSLY